MALIAPPQPVTHLDLPGLAKFTSGKVREVFDLQDALLIVATDRISAFDVIFQEGIPDKGRILTQLSAFWFSNTQQICQNHVISLSADDISAAASTASAALGGEELETLEGRSMLVKKTRPFPVECVVRGYLSGSAWKEYRSAGGGGTVNLYGIDLPAGLIESDKLPEPIFTPATKAASGHDINIPEKEMADMVGAETTQVLKEKSLALYRYAADYAAKRGIIIADTKFEFGRIGDDIILIDEALTPDSSRFWPADQYRPGGPQPSYDKQYLRDYLESLSWNKEPPPPPLPESVVSGTAKRYQEALEKLTREG